MSANSTQVDSARSVQDFQSIKPRGTRDSSITSASGCTSPAYSNITDAHIHPEDLSDSDTMRDTRAESSPLSSAPLSPVLNQIAMELYLTAIKDARGTLQALSEEALSQFPPRRIVPKESPKYIPARKMLRARTVHISKHDLSNEKTRKSDRRELHDAAKTKITRISALRQSLYDYRCDTLLDHTDLARGIKALCSMPAQGTSMKVQMTAMRFFNHVAHCFPVMDSSWRQNSYTTVTTTETNHVDARSRADLRCFWPVYDELCTEVEKLNAGLVTKFQLEMTVIELFDMDGDLLEEFRGFLA